MPEVKGMQRPENYTGTEEEYAEFQGPKEDGMVDNMSMNLRGTDGEIRWVGIARNAYESSTDYFDANIRTQLEKNIDLFNSKHPAGSKYHLDSYKFRSKLFRPKTRSMIRRHEASAALAFFSTADAVSCTAEDSGNKQHVRGAEYAKNLIEFRLEHSVPWFQTICGGYQDAMNQGVVISRQEWLFERRTEMVAKPSLNMLQMPLYDEDGNQLFEDVEVQKIVKDKPDIVLLPPENFRFDPACDWRDPVGSSPYLIELIPMYIKDIKARMDADNDKTGEKKWIRLSDGEIVSATQTGDYDSTRLKREGNREDSKDVKHAVGLFDIVWVHRNIVNVEGQDWLYYTMGTEHLLSTPVKLEDVFFHGRPYAVGTANIETHKVYPAAVTEMGEQLQLEANDTVNQRMDNVKLVLNKRHYARRGTNIDFRALTSSTPGGVVLMDDLSDVQESKMSDVTGSSYQEQDRINVDFDELTGTFNQSSVQTNRSLNETVGGMNMANDDSNAISEYQLRIYTETWVERVLKQMLQMEIHYETDERILKIAAGDPDKDMEMEGQMAGQPQQPMQPGQMAPPAQEEATETPAEIVAELIKAPIGVKVSVGFGATAPYKRIEKLALGLKTIGEFSPGALLDLDAEEIKKEVFGALGFRDGKRFFKGEVDPQVAQLQQQLQEAMKVIETKQVEAQGRAQVAKITQQGGMQREQLKLQHSGAMEQLKSKLNYIGHQITAETNDLKRGELILEEKALLWKMKIEELNQIRSEYERLTGDQSQLGTAAGNQSAVDGDGLVDDKGSTVMMNDRYQMVPNAEG